MMTRSPDILFKAEYIKNVLYFATVRSGKNLKSTSDTHYFSIDNDLVYENYFSDFGPLNLGCVFKYCKILNDKLNQYLSKQKIVHYTTSDPQKKANSAFLMGCYGVIYLSLLPRDALKPLMVHGQSYRPFQDATQGDSTFTITLMDCLLAIKKAKDLGLFNFHDFNYEEYERLDKIQGGDLNWILPGKFLAFIGPVDYTVSLYHPPDMYIDYFLENNVDIVIRLNKRLYDANVFNNAGIVHYDLYFPDGSCPPRHVLQKFLQISEEAVGAIAVHCKAGLGRTGSLIGCYLIKHYRMTAREAIGWMRICRPGSVIGHQQAWLEQLEAWLIKQGNLYRKRTFNDTERLPHHEFGIYSIADKARKYRPAVCRKSPSPPPPAARVIRTDVAVSIARPQSPRIRDDKTVSSDEENEEIFLTSCDLTIQPDRPMTQMKGCIIKNSTITDDHDEPEPLPSEKVPLWKQTIFCMPCIKTVRDVFWAISVRCARVAPGTCYYNRICSLLDMVAVNKAQKEQHEWRVKTPKITPQQIPLKGDQLEGSVSPLRRRSGAGEPRPPRPISRNIQPPQKINSKSEESSSNAPKSGGYNPTVTTFRSSNGPLIKNLNDARKFLIKSSIHTEERDKQLNSSVTVTPHYSTGIPSYMKTRDSSTGYNMASNLTPTVITAPRQTQPQQRRRLGRSPSPSSTRLPATRLSHERNRATNTPSNAKTPLLPPKSNMKDNARSSLREALSRLILAAPRDGSVGAASLGARRDAPAPNQAPSVRSDERPLATQGDMLNSIKFQRRYRESLQNEKISEFSFSKSSKNNQNSVNSIARSGPRKTDGTIDYACRRAASPCRRGSALLQVAAPRLGSEGVNEMKASERYPREKQSLLSGQRGARPTSPKLRKRTDSFSDR